MLKLLIAVVVCLVLAAAFPALKDGMVPNVSAAASDTAPCAPVLSERKLPTAAPLAPSGLRIISALGALAVKPLEASGTSGAVDTGAHAYFDRLSLLTECMVAYSLRDDVQIHSLTQQKYNPRYVTYDPAGDRDPRRQDAAKVVIPDDKVSLPNQVRLPIPPVGSDSLLVTWDVWWGKEFAYENTTTGNYKAFQFASPARIWTEIKSDFNEAVKHAPAVAMVKVRYYGSRTFGDWGPNITDNHPLSPQAAQFAILPEIWTRYWAYFQPDGDWFRFSLWMADVNRDPVLVLDGRQIRPNVLNGADGWQSFWLEYNTSSVGVPETRGPLVSYARNVVMLRGVRSPSLLLERPRR